jgi:hypothetical protein
MHDPAAASGGQERSCCPLKLPCITPIEPIRLGSFANRNWGGIHAPLFGFAVCRFCSVVRGVRHAVANATVQIGFFANIAAIKSETYLSSALTPNRKD